MLAVPADTEPPAPTPGAVLSDSAPNILSIATSHEDVTITCDALGGTTNVLQSAVAPGGPYLDVSPPLAASGQGRTSATFTNSGAITNSSPRFYRIRQSK